MESANRLWEGGPENPKRIVQVDPSGRWLLVNAMGDRAVTVSPPGCPTRLKDSCGAWQMQRRRALFVLSRPDCFIDRWSQYFQGVASY